MTRGRERTGRADAGPGSAGPHDDGANIAVVVGRIAGDVRVTTLADGVTVRNLEVAVRDEGGSRVPVAWYDAVRPPALAAGDAVVVVGRVRRRWFRTGGASTSRTEVVASVVARRGSRRAATALEDVRTRVTTAATGAR